MYFEYCFGFCIFSRFYVAARAYKISEALQEMSHEIILSKVNDFKGEFNLTTLKELLSD